MEPLQDIKLNIDKTNWPLVKLGDVVLEPRDVVKDFSKENIEHVVGLEHIDSEDIHLRRSASIEEETTFTKKFEKGDVLFGRRRAYLKKAARAEFSGICSGDITVLRAKKGLLPELLPFIINNDKFFDYAVKHSAGGLSPRVKFRDLANYEFLLPPKDQQAQIAELLWAMDEVEEKDLSALNKNRLVRESFLKKIFIDIPETNHLKNFSKIGDLIKLSSGKTRPKDISTKQQKDYIYPVYGGNGIIGFAKEYLIDYNTIVIGRVGEYCGVVHNSNSKTWISDNALYVTDFLTDLNKNYISRFLEFIDLNKQQNKGSHPLINQSKIYSNRIAVLDNFLIDNLLNKLRHIENTSNLLNNKISNSKSLHKSLINQIF